MNVSQRAVRGAAWSVLQNWGGRLTDLVVFVTLARFIAPEAFGIVALASVFIAFMEISLGLGFSAAIVQRKEIENAHLDTAFWCVLILGVAFMLAGIAGSGLVERAFATEGLADVIKVVSLVFIFHALASIQQGILRRRMLFKLLAVRTLVATAISGLVAVLMAVNGFGIWSLVAQQVVRAGVACVLLWVTSDWRPGFSISTRHFQELFGFSANVIGINALTFLNQRSDQLLIGYFLGPVALGYYTVGYRVVLILIQLVASTTGQVALPAFAKLQDDLPRLRSGLCTAINLTAFISFPAFLLLAALAPTMVPLLFGQQWSPSVPIMQVLALIGIVQSVVYLNGQAVMATGKAGLALKYHAINTAANLVAFAIAVQWGIVAVATAFVLRGYILSPMWVFALSNLIGLRASRYLANLAGPAGAAGTMFVAVLALNAYGPTFGGPIGLIVVDVLFGSLVYLSTLFVLNRATINRVLRALQNLRRKK